MGGILDHGMECPLFCFYLKLGHKHLLFATEILLLLEIKNEESQSEDDRQNTNLKIATFFFFLLLTKSMKFRAKERIHQNRHEELIWQFG